MRAVGVLRKDGGSWTIKDTATGEDLIVEGQEFPVRAEGCNVELIGNIKDDNVGIFAADTRTLLVQRWRTL